ncbi:Zinc finger CCCH domain-containing protein 6 [Apostasia shenzhenica]|uniref:Zinc finger CCCH domain-containing protein 6 n=1 Tax=Apostasia shenzhenica TaxID=1088818 RepID=A0A2H9ZZP3_9ASPA|nr:Zinc finger CCCH domain-containing protein 6 [Apostasia shenzhenica]
MAELKRAKRVSWASAVNLCQILWIMQSNLLPLFIFFKIPVSVALNFLLISADFLSLIDLSTDALFLMKEALGNCEIGSVSMVRLFLSDDAPYLSASGNQDNLQAKSSLVPHSTSVSSDESLPPGFEAPFQYQFNREIPLVKWQQPPRLSLKQEWLVVCGEESQEVALQNQRQLRVLEEIYPRQSCIPLNPSVSPELQASLVIPADDSQTPIIPIISMDDDDDLPDQQDSSVLSPPTPLNASRISAPPAVPEQLLADSADRPLPPSPTLPPHATAAAKPDVVAAASAAFTAIMRSNEEGSLIDRDLLIKLLSNPIMIEQMISEKAAPKPLTQPSPEPSPSPVVVMQKLMSEDGAPKPVMQEPPSPVIPAVYPVKALVQPSHADAPVKDLSYYKSLIQKHGGDKQDGIRHEWGGKALETMVQGKVDWRGKTSRNPKHCVFFNSPKGCRNGVNCSYLHDSSVSMKILQQGGPKRVKLEREIVGRN